MLRTQEYKVNDLLSKDLQKFVKNLLTKEVFEITGWSIPKPFKVKQRSNMVKTYKKWSASRLSLTIYLEVGDKVDQSIVDYFIEVLPPITTATTIQISEPYDIKDGQYTYMTIEFKHGEWYYAGIKPDMRKVATTDYRGRNYTKEV